ncbi:MAG: hypothetical protein ACRDLS_02445 [Solirubrobacteraceae bacterium]
MRADLPRGWTPTAQTAQSRSNCAAVEAARAAVSARASSPDFSHEPTGQVSHTVYLYGDEPQAENAYEALTISRTRRCLGDEVRARIVKEAADVDVGAVRTAPLVIDPVGEESSAARVALDYGTAGTQYTLTADLVFVRDGRGLAFLVLADETGTFDEQLRARLATVADRRLRAALEDATG